jgi:hypothetical protein
MEGFRVGAKSAVEGDRDPEPAYRDDCPKLAKWAVRTGLQDRAVRNTLKAFSPPKVISCPPTCAVPGSLSAAGPRSWVYFPVAGVETLTPATLRFLFG